MSRTKDGFRLREQSKSALVAILGISRHAALEFADRMMASGVVEQRDDVFMLTPADIWCFASGEWLGAGAGELVKDRRRQWMLWREAEAPSDVIFETADSKTAAASVDLFPGRRGAVIQGIAASPGVARGLARKLTDPSDAAALREGGILVARSTDPSWTPLFLGAQGLIFEIGGYLSHGAIAAREFGIPAVVNIRNGFDSIPEGANLVVDGDRGVVRIQDKRIGNDHPENWWVGR
jgi:rifampicin phosphotransferase